MHSAMYTIALISLTSTIASESVAQTLNRQVDIPKNCEPFVTVQNEGCTVDHLFTCQYQPDSYTNRISFNETGASSLSVIDGETQWINMYRFATGARETLEDSPADPASFTDLIETGVDTFDFKMKSTQDGISRYVGYDQLPGESETIDGIKLEKTEYNISVYEQDGTLLHQATGQQYIHKEWRVFFSGETWLEIDGEPHQIKEAPVEFIFPSEKGFLSPNPKYGCGAQISSLAPSKNHS